MDANDRTGRLPTMSDVAAHVGVSRQLVSLVLRGAPGPSRQARERVLAAAAELGYRANASARLLRQKRTFLLGALFSMRNPYESRLVERLFSAAAARGFGVVLGPVTDEADRLRVIEGLLEQRVEGLVGFVPRSTTPELERLTAQVPLVWLGGPAPGDNVHIDDVAGMRAAIGHLRGLGHRRIAHLRGDGSPAGEERCRAYRQAMDEAGLSSQTTVLGGGWDEESGADVARDLLRRRPSDAPTAVVCASDQAAAGLVQVLRTGDGALPGVDVPGRVSVVGWDDSYLAALSFLDLTSVRQEIAATADAALDLVSRRLEDPATPVETVLTAPTLVERGSTGPARAHRGTPSSQRLARSKQTSD
ncbi:LacI family DNA-binding transcriptional regulator [Kineococcus sp. SYSU DK003]|uniref:LacI family DNA-binding transcriptional regulator n=1 Tax=Kineococcus sp. SYSU DK003 TaxID=3383124 RepID=UPI003D7CA324